MDQIEDLARRVADCLERHLHEYGWEPCRYPPGLAHPEGEHKGVEFYAPDRIVLVGADGTSATVTIV